VEFLLLSSFWLWRSWALGLALLAVAGLALAATAVHSLETRLHSLAESVRFPLKAHHHMCVLLLNNMCVLFRVLEPGSLGSLVYRRRHLPHLRLMFRQSANSQKTTMRSRVRRVFKRSRVIQRSARMHALA